MFDVPFVDAHVHFWDLTRLRYPWLAPPFTADGPNGSVEAIARPVSPDDYRTALAGTDLRGAVHVEAGAHPADALAETEWLDEQAARCGLPDGIVAHAVLDDPAIHALLERQAAHPRVRGIRHIVNWHRDPRRSYTPRDVTRDERWRHGLALLERHRLSFDLQCYPVQMIELAGVLARLPRLPVVIDHLGMPVLDDADGLATWRQGLRLLAALPNSAIKISGFGFIRRKWTVAQVQPFVDEAIALFGTDRCMVATNLPTDELFAPVPRCLDALGEVTARYTQEDRRDLFGRAADRFYRLGLNLDPRA